MTRGSLSVEVLWNDRDLLEVLVVVSNRCFSGATNLYVGLHDLRAAADQICGFPTDPDDERRVLWGSEKPESRTGGVALSFRCRDAVGHCVVDAELRSSDLGSEPAGQLVRLQLAFEPASMDRFVKALLDVDREKRGMAVLEGAA